MRGRIVAGAASVLLSVGAIAAPALAAPGDQGASKESLIGPFANFLCSSLEPIDTTSDPYGFVVFNEVRGEVKAQVVLKNATPNTEHHVRLVQGGVTGSDCHVVDGIITTNRNGNGTIHLSEPIRETRAQIFIGTGGSHTPPFYRASDLFDFGTN